MVKINRIYTRTGDSGETGLVGGKRIAKDAPRVEAFGDIDELNAHLGVCRTLAAGEKRPELEQQLALIQNELFDIGSRVATPPKERWDGMIEVSPEQITRLEHSIDGLVAKVPELRSFVLPGGTPLNAALHVARAVCRRAERRVLSLSRKEEVPQLVLVYLNRLSDLLFAMARSAAHAAGAQEFLWKPGGK